jgi:uncharacterized NAD(P)/FAD-binding protein YdhS
LNQLKPKQQKAKQDKSASSSTFASDQDTKIKTAILAAEKKTLENLLKQQQKQQKEFLLNNSIRQLKKKMEIDIDRRQERYLEVVVAKQKKQELLFEKLEIKKKTNISKKETVAFDIHRFKCHPELYNRFNVLEDQGNLLFTKLHH